MQIAFIHPFLFRYARGIERYTVNLSSNLVKNGVHVDIFTWKWSPPVVWSELDSRVCVNALPISRYFTAALVWPFYLLHLLHSRYDHLFIHFADYGEARALKWLLKMRPQTAFSIVLHFPYSQVPHRYHSLVKSGLYHRARHLIAVSQFVACEAEAFGGRSCQVIPHGVDSEYFRSDHEQRLYSRKKLGFDPDAVILLTIAALEKRKGIQDVFTILPRLQQIYPKLRYLVVGDGPDQAEIASCIDTGLLKKVVRMLPADPDVLAYYQAADFFIIPARGEASSLVSLEALACELPVIAANTKPFDEMISPEWGILVDPTQPDQMVEAINSLANSRDLCRKLGFAGRKYVIQSHRWDEIAGRYMHLLMTDE